MAEINFDEHPGFSAGTYDVVVIGAGAAGLYLASKLSATRRVLVLESGHFVEDDGRQALNEVVQTGKPLQAAVWGRKRAVGGSTIAWGGQSLPFTPLDFEDRGWVENSGWPFGADELRRHYDAANSAMGIDTLDYRDEAFAWLGRRPSGFDPALVDVHVSKWAREPRFRKVFADRIGAAFDVLYNCHVKRLRLDRDGSASVEVQNFRGDEAALAAEQLVIAAGTIETVRLLLVAEREFSPWTAPQRASLGVGFLDHPCIDAGVVVPRDSYAFQKLFGTQVKRGRKYSIRLSTAEDLLRAEGLLSVSASLMAFTHTRDFDPYREFKDVRKLLASPGRVATTAGALSRTAWALGKDRFLYKHDPVITLALMCEQEPAQTSTLSLHPTATDAFGVPKLVVNWEVTPLTWTSVVRFCGIVRDEIARLDLGEVALRPELSWDAHAGTALLTDVNHHMGGSAMRADPEASVVAPDLSVRGVRNLSVCSAAAFPSGAHSNPTLTLLALADRLAERLAQAPNA